MYALSAAAVSHADRDALRAVRQRMYAALKERAALGVCYEEQRWEAYAARDRASDETRLDVAGSTVDAGGEASEEAREVAGSSPGGGEPDGESSALSSPPTPAATREEDPPGSLDATLDDDAMND